jgi:diphthamide biosynthesis protein 2
MANNLEAPPVLSTPAEHIFEDPTVAIPLDESDAPKRTEDELFTTYEISRTAREIREGGWKRIALQFPDSMLVDAGWIINALNKELLSLETETEVNGDVASVESEESNPPSRAAAQKQYRLYILADTSYSACCVDEIAAEHADAEVVVHYGRTCLSPTSRLPVIYVFTQHYLDHTSAATAFESEFTDKSAKIVVMADVTYQQFIIPLVATLKEKGYTRVVSTSVVNNPAGTIPNRKVEWVETIPTEEEEETYLKDYSIFHISNPPSSLLLALSSRVASLHVLDTSTKASSGGGLAMENPTMTTRRLLQRRYAKVLKLATAGVIGILVNTLSVSNYLSSIDILRRRISEAGKKSYTVVVGKLNAAKLANFAEVDGWVVVGCWESGLVEEDASFFRPVIAPFELEVALMPDEERVWGVEWWGGIEKLNLKETEMKSAEGANGTGGSCHTSESIGVETRSEQFDDGVEGEESSPPEFDLRTGRLVSTSRPMRAVAIRGTGVEQKARLSTEADPSTGPGSAVVKRAVAGEVATINGVVSPGAEYLLANRTWQGLGTDYGEEASTLVEEGRSGVARGYTVGEEARRH